MVLGKSLNFEFSWKEFILCGNYKHFTEKQDFFDNFLGDGSVEKRHVQLFLTNSSVSSRKQIKGKFLVILILCEEIPVSGKL